MDSGLPTHYHINTEDELVSLHANGPTDLEQVLKVVNALQADPSYDPQWPHLADLREMEIVPPEDAPLVIESLAEYYRDNVKARVAIVVAADIDRDVCADIFRFTCAVPSTELFDEYKDALMWLIRTDFVADESQQPPPKEPPLSYARSAD